jgi:DNA polymerase-1
MYGFFTTLRALRNRYLDFKFYVVWDNVPKKKIEAFAEYKANRDHSRVSLPIADLKQALQYLNITQVECSGEEADDVIATLVQSCDGKDYIYSSDKDPQQLVIDGQIIVISPKVGAIPEKFYDEEAIKVKWGVGPRDLACLFAFKGDTSDNIPGTSVPSKVLAPLTIKYRDPEMIYSSLDAEKLTDFQRTALIKNKNQVILNYSIINLKKDLCCVYTTGKSFSEKLKEIFDKYEIKVLSPESMVALFDADTEFLHRTSPSLKTVSLFDD